MSFTTIRAGLCTIEVPFQIDLIVYSYVHGICKVIILSHLIKSMKISCVSSCAVGFSISLASKFPPRPEKHKCYFNV